MRILVIYCHPNEKSFVNSLHKQVLQSLRTSGHTVIDLDLYSEEFRPVMSREERKKYENPCEYKVTVQKYADQLVGVEAIVAVYPTWWYGLPAMLKGYFDRVWAPGIAFDIGTDGKFETDRLRQIKKLAVVTTYGASWWLIRLYLGDPERKLWGRAIRKLCGKGCTLDWLALYNIDHSSNTQRHMFNEKVREVFSRWQ